MPLMKEEEEKAGKPRKSGSGRTSPVPPVTLAVPTVEQLTPKAQATESSQTTQTKPISAASLDDSSRRITRANSPTSFPDDAAVREFAQDERYFLLCAILEDLETPQEHSLVEVQSTFEHAKQLHEAFQDDHLYLVNNGPPSQLARPYFADHLATKEALKYHKIVKILGRLITELTPSQDVSLPSSESSQRARSRLPELTVPHFAGEYLKWPEFKAMFSSVIADRTDISDLERFQYLKGALSGPASELITNLPPVDASFSSAWGLLTARFESKRLIVSSYLDRIFNLTPMKRRSSVSLLKLVNIANETSQALLTVTAQDCSNCVMVHLFTRLLDSDTREQWEHSISDTQEYPTLSQLTTFLTTRARALENLERTTQTVTSSKTPVARASTHHATSSQQPVQPAKRAPRPEASYACDMCAGSHFIVTCAQFRELQVHKRMLVVRDKCLCYSCLGRHNIRKCNSTRVCKMCGGRHHTMLHGGDLSILFEGRPAARSSTQPAPKAISRAHHSTLLATALATVNSHTSSHQVRILIDQGSEITLISESLAQQLTTHREHSTLDIIGVGGKCVAQTRGRVKLTLHSNHRLLTATVNAYILKTLTTTLPSLEAVQHDDWPHLKNLTLADPDFLIPRPIDIILGADHYGLVIKPNIIRLNDTAPIAQLSIFGWLVLGPVYSTASTFKRTHHVCVQRHDHHLDEMLAQFWAQEEHPTNLKAQLTPEEQECEEHFKTTHTRDSSGRYTVRIPLKLSTNVLGDSYETAHKCLQRLTKRLLKNPDYKNLYTRFMKEYEQLTHMVEISKDSIISPVQYYLPHHGVLKPDSSTTKLRVVFNGSSASSSGYSVNDLMHTGANLLLNIMDVLIWIRTHRHIFSTDITKMYRQIRVHPDDWNLQRILWIDEELNEKQYHLTTVTYGTKAAPFLAVRTLLQLAEDEAHRFPLAVPSITHGRYVDDIFGGADSVEKLTEVATQVQQMCHSGGFPLAKWHSTHPKLLETFSPHEEANTEIAFADCKTKILGLSWSPQQDSFHFSSMSETHRVSLTKRQILSEVATIFDPLGFTSPVVVKAKILLQELWLLKLNWDDTLPSHVVSKWIDIREDLICLARLSIPRWFNTFSNSIVELHGFSDASQLAMAAVVYITVYSPSTTKVTSLVCSKTKVAPLKRLTIPRLELAAALLLAKLTSHVQATLKWDISNTYLWTDSQVALTWIKSHPSRWKDFVSNRVTQIQELTKSAHWKYTPGTSNPADCASRGVSTDQLKDHELWWTGPPWLTNPEHWPSQTWKPPEPSALEARPGLTLMATQRVKDYHWDLIYRYSSLMKLLRITALCFRFGSNARASLTKQPIPLITSDIEWSRQFWIKATQSTYFSEELKLLRNHAHLPSTHPFSRLTAFIDHQDILRVGGRLNNADLTREAKHPAILPRKSRLSELIIDCSHKHTLHGGTQLTLAHIRQHYWILGGRAPVKSHVLRCVVCARQRGIRAQQMMGQLPLARVQPSRAFAHTGIDYAGPITLKTWKGRGSKTHKGWICVFVCLTTSAVHLEVVSDYSTEGFIATYRRFTSRRGIPTALYSDCGTNFIGAESSLRKLFTQSTTENNRLIALLTEDRSTWHFNPPAAPHMGGKWEAVVKSIKYHIRRTVSEILLTYEELTTLLAQIEAVLNSRPLEPLSDDPQDISALTPGHFLIGSALNAVPEPSLLDISTTRVSRWQFIQQRVQQFWAQWSAHYLQRLQAISKWHHPNNTIKEGSLVLISDERFPPCKWPLARVRSLMPGKDGLTRVAELKTATTTLIRPIIKLILLPIGSQPDQLIKDHQHSC